MENKKNQEESKKEHKDSQKEHKEAKEEQDKMVTLKESEYAEFKQLAEKVLECQNRILRLQADYENSRKRWEREKQDFARFANEEVLADILNILDDLERSVELSRQHQQDISAFSKGLEMILSHFHALLKKHGVTPMEAKGRIFNPNFHEALMMMEKEDVPEHTILEEMQKGYMINNKVLRTAKVQISKKKSTEQCEAVQETSEKLKSEEISKTEQISKDSEKKQAMDSGSSSQTKTL